MMIKNNRIILSHNKSSILAAMPALLLLMGSCMTDRFDSPYASDPDAGFLTLTLSNSSLRTRAELVYDTVPDIDALNENKIVDALICLFPSDATDQDEPTYKTTVSFDNCYTEAEVKIRIDRDLIYSLFPDDSGNKAKAYVVANLQGNLPEGQEIPESPTMAQLKALPIASNFASGTSVPSSFVMDGTSEITLNLNEEDPTKSSISGEVYLTRAAAKINLGMKVAETVTDGYGNEWAPVAGENGMYVLMNNGVYRSNVTPTYTIDNQNYYNTSTEDGNQHKLMEDNAEEEFIYTLTETPYYTYPNSWADENDDMTYLSLSVLWKRTDAPEFRTCYYMVPILREGSALVRNVSYRVNINVAILGSFTPDEPLLLEDVSYRAVEWGKETISVSIDDYRYLVLDQTDYTLNNEGTISVPFYSSHNSEITNMKLTYYLYNTDAEGLEVPVEITMEQNKNSEAHVGDSTINIYSSWIDNTIDATTSSRTLNFKHPLYQWTPCDENGKPVVLSGTLGNDGKIVYPEEDLKDLIDDISYYEITENQPFSRYVAEITIVQSDKKGTPEEPNFTKTIKITQYPGIYITSDKNPGNCNYRILYYYNGSNRYANTNNNANNNFGYVFVDAAWYEADQSSSNKPYWNCRRLGSLKPFDPDSINNPNMYLVQISQLSQSDSIYSIGDPRLTVVNNLNNANTDDIVAGDPTVATWDNPAPFMYNQSQTINTTQWFQDTRHLTNYYPTDESEVTEKMISPKLRIASEYSSMTAALGRENIRKRCATYQERCYPAGRWRLPTKAELEYIVSLTSSGKLPTLFNYDGYYWTAHGIFHLLTGEDAGKIEGPITERTTAFVRPVYDDGYWSDVLPENNSNNLCRGSLFIYTFGDKLR